MRLDNVSWWGLVSRWHVIVGWPCYGHALTACGRTVLSTSWAKALRKTLPRRGRCRTCEDRVRRA